MSDITKLNATFEARLKVTELNSSAYNTLLNKARNNAALLLQTELQLADRLNSIPTKQGKRSDLENVDDDVEVEQTPALKKLDEKERKTKQDIITQEFGLTKAQARQIAKLTPRGVALAILHARLHNIIPTRKLALQLAGKSPTTEKVEPVVFEGQYAQQHIKRDINEIVNYTQLFANAGIGEYELKRIGVVNTLANELKEDRAKFYKEIYPECEMIQGDITDKKVLTALVDKHIELGNVGIHASPPCQDFSVAGKKDFTNTRAHLFFQMLEFIRRVDSVNQYVLIENVPAFLTAKPKTLAYLLQGKTIGQYIQSELEALGYKVNICVQNCADYGTAQSRERAIILACKVDLWPFPKKDKSRKMLFEVIGDLPSLEPGQDSGIKYHKAPDVAIAQANVLRHTPVGQSAHDNVVQWQPVNVDGTFTARQFKSSFQRRDWQKPCNTVCMDSGSITGLRTVHPGRPLTDGTTSDPRPFTILELLRVTGLPDDYPIPEWASDKLIRDVIGECFVPKHVNRLLHTLPSFNK